MLEALIREQETHGLSDQAMADRLGVPRSTWQALRKGTLALSDDVAGVRIARAARREFPHLQEAADRYLLFGDEPMAVAS